MSYGQKSHVAIAFQEAWGSSNVTSLYHMQHLDENVGLEIPDLVDESARGVFDEGDSYAGPKVVNGDLTINVKSIPLGVLFRGIFGAATVVQAESADVFTHTFKPRTADFGDESAGDPLTYFKFLDDGGSASLFYNLNINGLELGVSNGEFLTAKASFVGGSFEQNADIAAAFPSGKRLTWDAASLQLGGAAVGTIKALTVKVDESLAAMHTLDGSKYPSRVKRTGARTIEVAGTILFDNQTEWQKFLAQTEEPMIATFVGPNEISSGYNDVLEITLPLLRHMDFKPVAPGIGQLEVGFTSKAKYSTTSATAMQIALTNLQPVY